MTSTFEDRWGPQARADRPTELSRLDADAGELRLMRDRVEQSEKDGCFDQDAWQHMLVLEDETRQFAPRRIDLTRDAEARVTYDLARANLVELEIRLAESRRRLVELEREARQSVQSAEVRTPSVSTPWRTA